MINTKTLKVPPVLQLSQIRNIGSALLYLCKVTVNRALQTLQKGPNLARLQPLFCISMEQQNKHQHLCPAPPINTKNNFPKYKKSHMKKTIFLLLFVFTFSIIKAQTINNTALQGYPNSVVVKVYDVASKVSLTATEQQSLADLFKDEENEIALLVISGATPYVIDSVKNNYKAEFNASLTSTQLANYYKATVASKAKTTGLLMSSMLRNKYNVDTTIERYFDSVLNWREAAIEKIWLRETDPTTRNNNLAYSYYIYDSLLSVYTNAAASGSYFMSRVFYLDSIMLVDSSKKNALSAAYFTNCINNKNNAFADNFNAAFNKVFHNISDTPYYNFLYRNEIINNTKNAAAVALSGYIKRDKVSTYTTQLIAPILLKQQRVIAFINKIYPTYTVAKDSIIDTLTVSYQRQIDAILAQDGNLHNASQLDIAIKYAAELGIVPDQENSLKIALSELNALRATYQHANPGSEYDSKSFESRKLSTILTDDQYTQILTLKYAAAAANMANTDWIELVRLGRTNDFVEADTKLELTNYHLAILIAYYRYAANVEIQYTTIQSINEIMPLAMHIILENWNYQRPYFDTPDTFFQW
jgi:hypothetical protein